MQGKKKGTKRRTWPSEGRKLAAVLVDLGVTPTELGRRLKLASDYRVVNNWRKGQGFTPQNQARVVKELGLPPEYFGDDSAARHVVDPAPAPAVQKYGDAWAKFLRTAEAAEASPEHLAELAKRRFKGTPTLSTYLFLLAALQSVQSDDDS